MSLPVRKIVWISAVIVSLPLLFALGFMIYITSTEFSPVAKSNVQITGSGKPIDPSRREFSFFSWNIGYAGLGREMDFFYDGGKLTRPPKEKCIQYFEGIKSVLKANISSDFILLQEVDVYSKRAWYQDEYIETSSMFPDHFHGFTPNYDCRFVPSPLSDPMGRVKAGLATFSSMRPDVATVQYYKSDFPWPTRLVMLKRCYLLYRFRLDNGKDLVVVNLHNSAYDSTGILREKELIVLDSVFNSENNRGNYVIMGGDWNSNPRGFNVKMICQGDLVTAIEPPIPETFLPGISFVYDSLNPSNRFTDIAYLKGLTRTTIIDFFVVSPNVEVSNVATIPTRFAFSDHEPLVMNVRLK
jgi:endonuclease/exonuclease/phosphatase family metal-dependent hydrolase